MSASLSHEASGLPYVRERLITVGQNHLAGMHANPLAEHTINSARTNIAWNKYKTPDKHSFYTIFDDVLTKIWMKWKNIVNLGDLNSDLIMKGKSKEDTYLGRRLLKIVNPFSLKSVINQPTRIAEKSQTMIDLIITSSPEKITVKGVSHLGISDHSIVYANIRVRKERAQRVFKTVNSYKNFNSEKFRKEVESAPWGVCNVFDDIEDQV